jgi:uncharacterized protein
VSEPRVLIDVVHPAHVHMFRHIASDLIIMGAEVRWLSRNRHGVPELLDGLAIPHRSVSRAAIRRGRLTDAVELSIRVARIRREIQTWKPHVLLTRNPSGVLAGLGTVTRTVFDTDDGRSVGLHHRLAAPFADVVTSSVHDPASYGRHHRRYPGFKAHAFLHPKRFRRDAGVRARFGIAEGALAVIRLSRHDASHDANARGMSSQSQQQLLDLLRRVGPVVVSIEGEPTRVLRTDGTDQSIPAADFHHLLAEAVVCVTDGQSVAAEAAVLGVPAFRLAIFPGPVWYLSHLEGLGLVRNFAINEVDELLSQIEAILTPTSSPVTRHSLTGDDVTQWFVELTLELVLE